MDFNPRSPWGERLKADLAAGKLKGISIHAPRGGGATKRLDPLNLIPLFQSTLPVWGATPCPGSWVTAAVNFNPRSPCGERQGKTYTYYEATQFQSTLPVWGATYCRLAALAELRISIHAPRVGSDRLSLLPVSCFCYFNPRSPCGERRYVLASDFSNIERFQSTLPVWGATQATQSVH